jgi:hypothetical protein
MMLFMVEKGFFSRGGPFMLCCSVVPLFLYD